MADNTVSSIELEYRNNDGGSTLLSCMGSNIGIVTPN